MLSVNPVDQIKKPPSPKARERRLNDGEYERLEAASKLTQNPHIWPIVVFAIETGMRRGEILGLELGQYRPEAPHSLSTADEEWL